VVKLTNLEKQVLRRLRACSSDTWTSASPMVRGEAWKWLVREGWVERRFGESLVVRLTSAGRRLVDGSLDVVSMEEPAEFIWPMDAALVQRGKGRGISSRRLRVTWEPEDLSEIALEETSPLGVPKVSAVNRVLLLAEDDLLWLGETLGPIARMIRQTREAQPDSKSSERLAEPVRLEPRSGGIIDGEIRGTTDGIVKTER
jgi:hypothetical protein